MRRADRVRRIYWHWRGKRILGASALAYTPDGKLLLIRQTYADGWLLPGGGRRASEEPVAAALRELREEIGLTHFSEPSWLTKIHQPFAGVTVAVDVICVLNVRYEFRPNLEVEDVLAFDPLALPADLAPCAETILREAGVIRHASYAGTV